MDIINRPTYLDHITSLLNRGMMLVLVGQRRVGKSYMLLALKDWLEKNQPQANVIYLNKEQKFGNELMDDEALYAFAKSRLEAGKSNFLLVDEVQNISNYEVALRNLYAEEACQIVITGSNAYLYSKELGTRLAGRYIEIPVYSLTYQEFLQFHKLEDTEQSLNLYIRNGGLPGLKNFDINNSAGVRDYLQGVYNTIMMRDVVERAQIRNGSFLTNLSRYVADTMGKIVSPNSIAGTMISQGEKISGPIVTSYLEHLTNALLINSVMRYDIHGKKLFEQNYKYYFSDHGIRNFLIGFKYADSIERLMENIVFHHLRVQGFEIAVGSLGKNEVDFVATKDEKTLYFQVTYIMRSEDTVKREFGNLKAIPNNYPKYVISMEPVTGELGDYPGINHIHLRDFLKMTF